MSAVPLPPLVRAEQQRVWEQSHHRVVVELGPRGRVPGGIAVHFHTRSHDAETEGVYLVRYHPNRLYVFMHAWTWNIHISYPAYP